MRRKLARLLPIAIVFQTSSCSWNASYVGTDGYVTGSFNNPGPSITTPSNGMVPPYGTPFVPGPTPANPFAGSGGMRP